MDLRLFRSIFQLFELLAHKSPDFRALVESQANIRGRKC